MFKLDDNNIKAKGISKLTKNKELKLLIINLGFYIIIQAQIK